MELYEYARPELMGGKKILFVHGFASGGQNGTVKTMRLLMPEAEVIAPDLPVNPHEAMDLLRSICRTEHPDLIIGTSMGGMMTEQLYGYDRIVVNPAFHLADTLLKNNGLGRQAFHNPRADGQESFMVTKGLLEQFREVSSKAFGNSGKDNSLIYGLFGIEDTLVDCYEEFAGHYAGAIRFHGTHYLNDHAFLHSVMPVIGWIDDRQENRTKKTIIVSSDGAVIDPRTDEAVPGAAKSFASLAENYDMYIVTGAGRTENLHKKTEKINDCIGVPCWNRIMISNHKELLMGDYLIDAEPGKNGGDSFWGTVVEYGSEQFRTWDDITAFFGRLGGQ